MAYLEDHWCGLEWTPWVKFNSSRSEWKRLQAKSGVYRVRPVDRPFLMYIGQTGRSLRVRLGELRSNTLSDVMPYDDPHTAAPGLWAWRQEEHWDYECSAAPTSLSERNRKALECYLLWQYRLEKNESTSCNHGRFHKNYIKSSLRAKHLRGRRLSPSEKRNPSGGPSHPPLRIRGEPSDCNWMGIEWTEMRPLDSGLGLVPGSASLYRLRNLKFRLLYIGETTNLRNRLAAHRRNYREDHEVKFSYALPDTSREYELRELENDLIGGYYSFSKSAPDDQFGRNRG